MMQGLESIHLFERITMKKLQDALQSENMNNVEDLNTSINDICKIHPYFNLKYLINTQSQLICEVARKGKFEIVQHLLNQLSDDSTHIDCRLDVLVIAADKGSLEIINYLLSDNFSDVNSKKYNDAIYRAIMYTAEKGHLEILKRLFDALGGDITDSEINIAYYRCIYDLAKAGHVVAMSSLLSWKDTDHFTIEQYHYQNARDFEILIEDAAKNNCVNVITYILSQLPNSEALNLINHFISKSLFSVLKIGHFEIINNLIKIIPYNFYLPRTLADIFKDRRLQNLVIKEELQQFAKKHINTEIIKKNEELIYDAVGFFSKFIEQPNYDDSVRHNDSMRYVQSVLNVLGIDNEKLKLFREFLDKKYNFQLLSNVCYFRKYNKGNRPIYDYESFFPLFKEMCGYSLAVLANNIILEEALKKNDIKVIAKNFKRFSHNDSINSTDISVSKNSVDIPIRSLIEVFESCISDFEIFFKNRTDKVLIGNIIEEETSNFLRDHFNEVITRENAQEIHNAMEFLGENTDIEEKLNHEDRIRKNELIKKSKFVLKSLDITTDKLDVLIKRLSEKYTGKIWIEHNSVDKFSRRFELVSEEYSHFEVFNSMLGLSSLVKELTQSKTQKRTPEIEITSSHVVKKTRTNCSDTIVNESFLDFSDKCLSEFGAKNLPVSSSKRSSVSSSKRSSVSSSKPSSVSSSKPSLVSSSKPSSVSSSKPSSVSSSKPSPVSSSKPSLVSSSKPSSVSRVVVSVNTIPLDDIPGYIRFLNDYLPIKDKIKFISSYMNDTNSSSTFSGIFLLGRFDTAQYFINDLKNYQLAISKILKSENIASIFIQEEIKTFVRQHFDNVINSENAQEIRFAIDNYLSKVDEFNQLLKSLDLSTDQLEGLKCDLTRKFPSIRITINALINEMFAHSPDETSCCNSHFSKFQEMLDLDWVVNKHLPDVIIQTSESRDCPSLTKDRWDCSEYDELCINRKIEIIQSLIANTSNDDSKDDFFKKIKYFFNDLKEYENAIYKMLSETEMSKTILEKEKSNFKGKRRVKTISILNEKYDDKIQESIIGFRQWMLKLERSTGAGLTSCGLYSSTRPSSGSNKRIASVESPQDTSSKKPRG